VDCPDGDTKEAYSANLSSLASGTWDVTFAGDSIPDPDSFPAGSIGFLAAHLVIVDSEGGTTPYCNPHGAIAITRTARKGKVKGKGEHKGKGGK
jgi:hypothetical protein